MAYVNNLLGNSALEDLCIYVHCEPLFSLNVLHSLVKGPGKQVDCVSERTVIASLFVQVPTSCLYGCLANCEVAVGDVREDNQWLVVG